MAFKIFTIPIQNSEQAEEELNVFLAGHKVLAVDRRWVDLLSAKAGPGSFPARSL